MKAFARVLLMGVFVSAIALLPTMMHAQWTQQGNKFIGAGAVSPFYFGNTLAISADGNTAIVGGPFGPNGVWVYTRSGEVWTQQGNRLVGTGTGGGGGYAVALSTDGNTALVGGNGGAYVFTRSGGTWSQQGGSLVGTGGGTSNQFGKSVALSTDGNTAVIGAPYDTTSSGGAIWIFTRTSGVWSQQGNKLVGSGAVGTGLQQGWSVGISPDGNTAFSGSTLDNSGAGAVWVFTRSGGIWSQQGNKLVATGNIGAAVFGRSIAISADGNTAAFGGNGDDNLLGAVWVFTRSGSTWSQQSKLVGTGQEGARVEQGMVVSLSSDGNRLISGGPSDASGIGAAWIFSRTGTTWSQDGNKLVGTGAVGNALQGTAVAMSPDGVRALVGGPQDANSIGAVWAYSHIGTSVREIGSTVPNAFSLEQNYPNPFNPSTTIRFRVAGSGFVSLKVFDGLGREVATVINENVTAGSYETTFDTKNLASGIYIYRLQAGALIESKKMILTK